MQKILLMNVKVMIGDRVLWNTSSLTANQGQKIGVIGKNGVGKTTLFRLLMGEYHQYTGKVVVSGTLDYFQQIPHQAVVSGGELTKERLLKHLTKAQDILLLDEPTNHLDSTNKKWLLDSLKKSKQTILVISHDRELLDEVVDTIWEIAEQKIEVYHGNYTLYEQMKQHKIVCQQKQYAQYQRTVSRLQVEVANRLQKASCMTKQKKNISHSEWKAVSFTASYDTQAKKKAKAAKAIEKRLERLEKVAPPKVERGIVLKSVGHLGETGMTLMTLRNVLIQQRQTKLFSIDYFTIKQGQHIVITGNNGSGKTTFYKQILTQTLKGYYHRKLAIGYFQQDLHHLNMEKTVYQEASLYSLQDRQTIERLLVGLGFAYPQLSQMINTLSGGERVKVALAQVLLGDYHLLILDEPTNFLDMQARIVLENFLKDYSGAFLLTTHDKHVISVVSNERYRIQKQTLVKEGYDCLTCSAKGSKEALQLKRARLLMDPSVPLEAIRRLDEELDKLF